MTTSRTTKRSRRSAGALLAVALAALGTGAFASSVSALDAGGEAAPAELGADPGSPLAAPSVTSETSAPPATAAAAAAPAPAPTLAPQGAGGDGGSSLDVPQGDFSRSAVTDNYKFIVSISAADPDTYDGSIPNSHPLGGGQFGAGPSIPGSGAVQELLARDFSCGDVVSYFVTVETDGPVPANQLSTVEADLSFGAGSEIDPGAGMTEVLGVTALNADPGARGVKDSVATLKSTSFTGTPYTRSALLKATIAVTNVERGDFVVVRVDTRLSCEYAMPRSGYLFGQVVGAREVSPNQQTVVASPVPVRMVQLVDLNTPFFFAASATPPKVIANRDVVTYTLRFASLLSDSPSSVASITDSVLGDVTNPSNPKLVSTNCTVPLSLPPLGSGEKTCTYSAKSSGAPRTNELHSLLAGDGFGRFASAAVSVRIADPRIGISKEFDEITDDADRSGTVTPGDTISYRITVTNTGDIRLTGVIVTELLAGASTPECSNLSGGALEEGAEATCAVHYVVTDADAAAGTIENSAQVSSNEASASVSSVSVGVSAAATTTTTAQVSAPAVTDPPPPSPTRGATVIAGSLPFTGAARTVQVVSFAVAVLAAGAALLVLGASTRRPSRPMGY